MRLLGADATSNKALKAVSPTHLAEAVQAAVLLIHDASDTISPLSQSESMAAAAALKRAGKRVQFKVLPGEDHYLEEPENRVQVLQEIRPFLATHLAALVTTTGD